jgi:hypothetical protein
MQLMTTEPHKSRHQILDAQSFYLNDTTLRQNIDYTLAEYLESPRQASVQANYSTFLAAPPESEIEHQNLARTGISPVDIEAEGIPSEVEFDSRSNSHTSSSNLQDSPITADDHPAYSSTQRIGSDIRFDSSTIPGNTNTASNSLNMNIQPTGFTKNHLLNSSLQGSDELSIKKRREDLSRRPSYRKIFNDLTGLGAPIDSTPVPNTQIITNAGPLAPPAAPHRQSPQHPVTNSNQMNSKDMNTPAGLQDPSIAVCQSPVSVVDLQTSTSSAVNQLAQQQLQHPSNHQQVSHLHHHIQPQTTQSTDHLHQHARHHHQQQQHHHHQQPPPPMHHPQASQLHQVHHMMNTASSPPITGKVVVGEEVNKKRELRLQKNREAAKECRRKKKEYIKCLENRVAVLENQNKALIDELKTLKDLYCKSTNE